MTPHFYPLRKNRSVRFGFCGSTVLVACSGDQVSFNTTVGVLGSSHALYPVLLIACQCSASLLPLLLVLVIVVS